MKTRLYVSHVPDIVCKKCLQGALKKTIGTKPVLQFLFAGRGDKLCEMRGAAHHDSPSLSELMER